MNFFMRGVPSNTDGYAIRTASNNSTLALCNAPADPIQGGCPARTGLDTFTIAITDIGPVDGTVPEPTTLSLLGLGLAGMYARRRHQSHALLGRSFAPGQRRAVARRPLLCNGTYLSCQTTTQLGRASRATEY